MNSYLAYVVDHESEPNQAGVTELSTDQLGDGEVTIRVAWSSVNYKDALAASPRGRVARISPLVPGIDLAGTIVESESPEFKSGQEVLAHGYGLGVSHHGGFAELARVPAGWIVPLPAGLTARGAMAIGTAGYTAGLCVLALEERGIKPSDGPILVLGASGGVGSAAVAILSTRGYEVFASTGKPDCGSLLEQLGAKEILSREETLADHRPIEKERWAGVVDTAGGPSLGYALSGLQYGAAAATCGNVAGADFNASIFPFILRGVALLGVDSVQTPIVRRRMVWGQLAGDLHPAGLEDLFTQECSLGDLDAVLASTLRGEGRGRTVVALS